ncbi:hypothetical protein [Wolbachia endosymbiont (group A) of Trypoxylon clavicerum]|uniref:hypothetical protein n=1 Tax=Wolbachia endosymbiont (group A) of Trypoxylon clavicerum TaxID=2954064 RepID=UPI002230121C|nr:hypothetical protein [Wolbachia endosymbiont (group A) of Trypoxylon clavicerum]
MASLKFCPQSLKQTFLIKLHRTSVWALAHWWELLPNYNVRTVVDSFAVSLSR